MAGKKTHYRIGGEKLSRSEVDGVSPVRIAGNGDGSPKSKRSLNWLKAKATQREAVKSAIRLQQSKMGPKHA